MFLTSQYSTCRSLKLLSHPCQVVLNALVESILPDPPSRLLYSQFTQLWEICRDWSHLAVNILVVHSTWCVSSWPPHCLRFWILLPCSDSTRMFSQVNRTLNMLNWQAKQLLMLTHTDRPVLWDTPSQPGLGGCQWVQESDCLVAVPDKQEVPVNGFDVHLQAVSTRSSMATLLTHKRLFSTMFRCFVHAQVVPG